MADEKKRRGRKPKPLSEVEEQAILAEIEELERYKRDIAEADPFWFFEPTDGGIKNREFLLKYLKDEDIPQRLDGQLDVLLSEGEIIAASGANQCLGGEAEIYDPVAKQYCRVDGIQNDFNVYAWDGQRLVIAKALRPFTKPIDDLYTITLSNGNEFVASLSHLVLTEYGYLPLSTVLAEDVPILQVSISDSAPSIHDGDGHCYDETVQDYQSCCPAYRHSCDEQLPDVLNICQDAVPLQGDVHEHKEQVFLHEDGLEYKPLHNHLCQSSGHPSSQDVNDHHEGHAVDILSHNAYMPYQQAYKKHQVSHQLPIVSSLQPQSTASFYPPAKYTGIHPFQDSPYLVTSCLVTNVAYKRTDVKYDFTVPLYHNYLLAGVIHHNSGKSCLGSISCFIQATGQVPFALKGIFPEWKLPKKFPQRIRVVGVSANQVQNTVIPTYKQWCPREYLKKGSWSESFSSEHQRLVLYKSGKEIASIEFKTNQQDVETFQGPPLDMVIYDEEPRSDIHKENLMRFVTAERLNILFCFTPTNGLTWATDLFTEDSPKIKRYQLCSVSNPKANLDALASIADEIVDYNELKMRLLGEFVSLSGLVYGKLFDQRTHVIQPFYEDLPDKKKRDYLTLFGCDPHLSTPFAGVWVLLDREGNCYVDRCYFKQVTTDEFKDDFWRISRDNNYRLGWSVADKSSDTSIMAYGGLNIFHSISRGKNALPAMRTSIKFEGSIKSGVDEIKKRLKDNKLFVVNRPENKELIQSFRNLERDTYTNEDVKGPKDRIREGKHHLHASMRYVFQYPLHWYAETLSAPEPSYFDSEVCY